MPSARSRSSGPSAAARRKLVEQAQRNAEEALDRHMAETTTQAKLLRELTEMFELPEVPQRIEVYDNSHIMGTNATGAMIVAGPEGFRKNSYRKFNIKSAQTDDDFGMMREVLAAALCPAREGRSRPRPQGDWPDLILIDGGKGQLNAVLEIMEDQGVSDVPVVGVAKGPHHGRDGREVFHLPGGRELTLPPNSALLFYLQRLRDEAHRFAIGTHRAKRAKSLTTSTLDEVPGIGPNRKRALLMHFGTARAVKSAALDDLERAPGISKAMARLIYDYFHPRGLPTGRNAVSRPAADPRLRAPQLHGEHGAIVRRDDRRAWPARRLMSAARGDGECGRCWSPAMSSRRGCRRGPKASSRRPRSSWSTAAGRC